MAGRSLALVALLALAAPAYAGTSDAQRFGRFAVRAHAAGSVAMTLRFTGLHSSDCDAAGTCGVTGTVTMRLTFDPKKAITSPAEGLLALPGKGTIAAKVTNPSCTDKPAIATAGLGFAPDPKGVLLRPGAVAAGATSQDPFATRCAGPSLLDLGNDVLPTVLVKGVPSGVRYVRFSLANRREFNTAGYAGSVTVSGKLSLRAS